MHCFIIPLSVFDLRQSQYSSSEYKITEKCTHRSRKFEIVNSSQFFHIWSLKKYIISSEKFAASS